MNGIGVVFLVVLGRCGLPRTGLERWEADVAPALVCPGDFVEVSWDAKTEDEACLTTCTRDGCGADCRRPTHGIISSSPEVHAPYSTYEQSGAFSAGPISTNTTFHFEALVGDRTVDTKERVVQVVLPAAETYVDVGFPGLCAGDRPAWGEVDLRVGVFRSEGVRVVHACNTSRFAINLTIAFESGSETYTLLAGECTPDFPPERGLKALSARVTDVIGIRTVACTTSSAFPESLSAAFLLACGIGGDIGEPPGPEPTTAGAAVGEEPTPTPTASGEEPGGRLTTNANCRVGPATTYESLDVFPAGDEVRIAGRSSSSPRWWWVAHIGTGTTCWLSDSVVETFGPVEGVPVRAAPPLPTDTPTAQAGCLYQGPNDAQPMCYAPCPVPSEQTQGACTP